MLFVKMVERVEHELGAANIDRERCLGVAACPPLVRGAGAVKDDRRPRTRDGRRHRRAIEQVDRFPADAVGRGPRSRR